MTCRSQKLRDSAKEAPHCMFCEAVNYDGQQLCLAHSNSLADGRGIGHKSDDRFGAILCSICHDMVDGRQGSLSKGAKRAMHASAWSNTVEWWIKNDYLKAAR